MTQFLEQLAERFAAGAPGFYVNTPEEARLDALLASMAQERGLHIVEWNLGLGQVRFDTKQPVGEPALKPDLSAFLERVRIESQYERRIFLIKNASLALENDRHAIGRLRQLLNLIEKHHAGQAAVLLVSESWQPPQELEAQLTQLKLPLPSLQEVLLELDAYAASIELQVPSDLRSQAATLLCGLTMKEIERVLRRVRATTDVLDHDALRLMLETKEGRIAQSGLLDMVPANESLADIGGLQNFKRWLTRKSHILKRLPEAQQMRIQLPKGCLIAGIPGCGKSLCAKVAATEFGQPLLRLDIGAMLGKYMGESEHNLRRALALAEAVSPCVLWVDELEKAFVGLSNGASEVSARLLGYFLTWMQERRSPVFVIATANDVTIIPPELLRKGRFDEIFYVGFPSLKERSEIFAVHLRKLGLDASAYELGALAQNSRDFTGADIENALNDALEQAFIEGRQPAQEDLLAAIRHTVPLRVTLREQIGQYEELFDRLKLTPASEEDAMSVSQMSKWASDDNPMRRKAVAEHPDAPDDLLEKLAEDSEDFVRKAALSNPSCPEAALAKRLAIKPEAPDFDRSLFDLASLHPNAPLDLLHHLKEQGQLRKKAAEVFEERARQANYQPAVQALAHIVIESPETIEPQNVIDIVRQIVDKTPPEVFRRLDAVAALYRPGWQEPESLWRQNKDGEWVLRQGPDDWDLSELIPNYDLAKWNSEEYQQGRDYMAKRLEVMEELSRIYKLSIKELQWKSDNNVENFDFAEIFFNTSTIAGIRKLKRILPLDLKWMAKIFKTTTEATTETNIETALGRIFIPKMGFPEFQTPSKLMSMLPKNEFSSALIKLTLDRMLNVMQKDKFIFVDKGRIPPQLEEAAETSAS